MSKAETITKKLKKLFVPRLLEVKNLSHLHVGHDHGGEDTHFHIVMVSERFNGKSRVERYRMVHEALKQELEAGLHALSCELKSAEEQGGAGDEV